jgi:hypothetical protein
MTNEEYTFAPPVTDGRKLVKGADGKWYYEQDEFNSQQSYMLAGSAATTITAGTVATGKKFHLRSIVCACTKKCTVKLHDASAAGAVKLAVRALTSGNVSITGLDGFVFTTAVFVEFTSAASGMVVSLGGVLDPQQTPGGA